MPAVAAAKKSVGTLALLGGGEWQAACRPVDEALLAAAGTDTVVVLAAAAAFEHPDRAINRARAWFHDLGAKVAQEFAGVGNRNEFADFQDADALKRQ